VLPADRGSYDNMAIGDGKTASRQYMRMVFADIDRSEAQRSAKTSGLLRKDTKSLNQVHEIVESDMMGLRQGASRSAFGDCPHREAARSRHQPALFESDNPLLPKAQIRQTKTPNPMWKGIIGSRGCESCLRRRRISLYQ